MPFSKKQKNVMLDQYEDWVRKSQAVIMMEYSKMGMKDINNLRSKVRETGCQVHVTKNTLLKRALEKAGYEGVEQEEGTTLCGFAYNDATALAKLISDLTKNSEVFKIKGGYMDGKTLTAEQVKALANLPTLPVMRATLLGVISAPATKLVRTLLEPAREVAAVVKAYSEKEAAPAA
ncbi:MAG: 50S ribosomal protein L10 [Anaerolineae bacterium]|nr:50S ribosomal protein L10 [Anaerolineae bacterium]